MADGAKGRAIVVEDNTVVAEVVRGVLDDCGYSVIGIARDGEAAVEMCLRLEPDVVLLDLQLPVMDGLTVARAINQRRPMPMVVLTGHDDPNLVKEASQAGIGAFLVKPPSAKELCRAINIARDRFEDLVELRRLNERLQHEMQERVRRESLYRSVVQTTSDGWWMMDTNGHCLDVNQAFAEMLGYTRQELLGSHIQKVEARDSPEDIARRIEQIVRIGTARFETEHRRKDGKTIHVEVIANYLPQEEVFIVFGRDMTERKQAEAALAAKSRVLETVFDSAPYVMMIVDDRGQITDLNRKGVEIASKAKSNLAGSCVGDVLGCTKASPGCQCTEPSCRIREAIRGTLLNGAPVLEERMGLEAVRGGTTVTLDVLLSTSPMETPEGLRVLVTIVDITERRRSEEEIRRRERLLSKIFEVLPVGVWVADRDGNLLSNNPEGLRIWGGPTVGARVWDGCRVRRMPSGEEIKLEDWALLRTVREGVSIDEELLEIDALDGEQRLILLSTAPVLDEDGTISGALVVNQDITDRKRLEAQLHQAMKMEAIGRLAGGVAHDFNNLLTGIMGNVELAMLDLSPGDPLFEVLIEVGDAAGSAAELTRQLLAFSRKQLIRPKVLDLNDVLVKLHRMLGRIIGEHIELETIAGDGLGAVRVDPGQFEQILVNLAVNARDAMPGGGRLSIVTENVELGEAYCRRNPDATCGRFVMLAVCDTGQGMDTETKSHLFEPFFTTKPKGIGTGLGLATIYGAVRQAGGSVEVESEVGKGTTFRVFLPRVDAQTEQVDIASSRLSMPGGSETILLVEDEASVRALAIRILERLGYDVLHASDGMEASRLARKHAGPIHLLLTDVVMPGMSGRQLADRIVEMHPETCVLYTSGYTEDAIACHGVIEEGVSFIAKPYTPHGLAQKLREVLGR